MKDRTPKYPGRVQLTPVDGTENTFDIVRADEPIEQGTPINKKTLLTDETAYLLELKVDDPTPDDAFNHIARNFVGDGGMNINLLEEMINMKYCKIIEAEHSAINTWLAAGALKCVADSYTGKYRFFARVVAESSAFEVRRVNKETGEIKDYSIAMSTTLTYTRSTNYTTCWIGRIVPVVVRHSEHMIFMYHGGYYYNSTYKGVIGTVCFDSTTKQLVSVGQASVTGSSLLSGTGYYNLLNSNGYCGSMLANAVRTDSGYIRFWCGYNGSYSGYIYSMKEGGTSFSSYSSNRGSSPDDYQYYPYYTALYKDDSAHITGNNYQYLVQFTDASTATSVGSYSISSATYYNYVSSIYSSNTFGGYGRSLTFSEDGLKSYFRFNYRSSPYTICQYENSSTVVAPTYSVISVNSAAVMEYWTLMPPNLRVTAAGETLLLDTSSGKYLQSMNFAVKPATNCYGDNISIATADNPPAVYQMKNSAGYILNHTGDGIIVWNQYGQVWELTFFDQDNQEFFEWTCPEDGTYKVLLVGGGAAGGATYGGGSGYLQIATVPLLKGDVVKYHVGKGGIYNQIVPAAAQVTQFGDLTAMPGNGQKGGAYGASTASGGGGGGYNLVTYGGQGQNYSSATQTLTLSTSSATVNTIGVVSSKDRNGGQSANSGACTAGDGYGAGGGYMQNGKDGVIVILR